MPSEPLQLSGVSDSPWVTLVCDHMHTACTERVLKRLGAPGKFQSPTGMLMHVTVEQVAPAPLGFPHYGLMCQCAVLSIRYDLPVAVVFEEGVPGYMHAQLQKI